MKRLFIISTLIIVAIFPTLFLWTNNLGELPFRNIAIKMIVLSIASIAFFFITRFFIKTDEKASLMTIASLLSYHFLTIVAPEWYNLIFIWIALTCLMIIIIKKWNGIKTQNMINNIFCIIASTLLILNIIPLIIFYTDSSRIQSQQIVKTNCNINNNIYYIILDAYEREDIQQEIFLYKSKLTPFLRDQGFYVVDKSTSNYPWTFCSIPSTLKMDYISDVLDDVNNGSKYQDIAINLIKNSVVSRTFKSLGYKYIYEAPFIERDNDYADIVFPKEEESLLWFSNNDRKYTIIPQEFNSIDDILGVIGKKFVFMHMETPHEPFVFNSDGSRNIKSLGFYDGQSYLNQLKFTESKTISFILKIRKYDPSAIIILQSDHGSDTTFSDKIWQSPSEMNIHERYSNLSAYYFPDGDYSILNKTMTSVNTFRIIFTKYFGYQEGLLPERNYFTGPGMPVKFSDITDIVKKNN